MTFWTLLACGRDPAPVVGPPATVPTTVPTTSSVPSSEPSPVIPDHLALPFATVGEAVGSAVLSVPGAVLAVTDGPFSVAADRVSYTGSVDAPTIATGTLEVTVDGITADVALAAVVGDPDLPFPDWAVDGWGTRSTAAFPSAPFPDDDASVLVFVPSVFTDRGDIGVLTHLHGFYAELARTVAYQRLVEQHAMSGRDAISSFPRGRWTRRPATSASSPTTAGTRGWSATWCRCCTATASWSGRSSGPRCCRRTPGATRRRPR